MEFSPLQAARGYSASRSATEPGATKPDAAAEVGKAAQSFADTLAEGETQATAALQGNADPHALVQALAESQLAVETAVTIRDRVVEAYQEILRMPV